MIARLIVSAALAASVACAQTERSRAATGGQAPAAKPTDTGPMPLHAAEPVVVRDGSIKVDVYARHNSPVRIEQPNTIFANAHRDNQATLLVPTRVVPIGKTRLGRLLTTSARAHRMMAVRRYAFEVENLERGRFVPYATLVFELVGISWRISPKGKNPLKLVGCSEPVALTGDWANHFQSTCEYGYKALLLRLGSVTVERQPDAPVKINLGTGCSEFRIEPISHRPHRMPFDHPPCEGIRPDLAHKYPGVKIRGVKAISAIDLSAAKRRTARAADNPPNR
jgi:hypothetical protein